MAKIKILVVDDHTIVRKGICALLNNENNIEITGEAENGREALSEIEKAPPDVVLMDISMPSLNGLEATRLIKKRFPDIKVLILTMHSSEEYVFEILKAGACGYVIKKAMPTELISAIEAVYRGDSYLSPSISRKVIDKFKINSRSAETETKYQPLTARERELLQLIAEGNTNRQIADLLFISLKTVESHRMNLMKKLDLHNAVELTRYALDQGIINPDG